jgi:hypothetical protein
MERSRPEKEVIKLSGVAPDRGLGEQASANIVVYLHLLMSCHIGDDSIVVLRGVIITIDIDG